MVINTNLSATFTAAQLSQSSNALAGSLQRLASGSKIVKASDDPAGLAESMDITAGVARTNAALNDVNDAISFSQTQDGYLSSIGTALTRMSELAIAAQDPTKSTSDLSDYNLEFQQLITFVQGVSSKTFNGVSLFSSVTLNVVTDPNPVSSSSVSSGMLSMVGISIGSILGSDVTNLGVTSAATAAAALSVLIGNSALGITGAIATIAADRAQVGAYESALNYTANQLSVLSQNLQAANSTIADVDVAQESTNYAKNNILVQAGTAMLTQANTVPQYMLRLLGA